MAIAPEKDSTVTFINVFTVTQANQQRLIDLLARATDGFVSRAPGFIPATCGTSSPYVTSRFINKPAVRINGQRHIRHLV